MLPIYLRSWEKTLCCLEWGWSFSIFPEKKRRRHGLARQRVRTAVEVAYRRLLGQIRLHTRFPRLRPPLPGGEWRVNVVEHLFELYKGAEFVKKRTRCCSIFIVFSLGVSRRLPPRFYASFFLGGGKGVFILNKKKVLSPFLLFDWL